MIKWFKWTAAALALAGLGAGLSAVAVDLLSDAKRRRAVQVQIEPVPYAQDGAAAAERGRYLYQSRGCVACHGANGAGRVFVDHPNGLRLQGANLTRGAGGAVAAYTERDWVRSIRHGVDPADRPLFAMPSEDFNRLTDADLADLVAYVRALPPVDAQGGEIRLPLVVKGLYAFGMLRDAAGKIDHTLPPSTPVPAGVSVAHGRYVAQACIGCHGAALTGGRIPGTPPAWPPAARLAAALRAAAPVYRMRGRDSLPLWLVTRQIDVRCVLRDPRIVKDRRAAVVPRAQQLDIGREPLPQLAFGHGLHYCLGAALARMEGAIAIGTLLRRAKGLRLAVAPAELRWRLGPLTRGLVALPLGFER